MCYPNRRKQDQPYKDNISISHAIKHKGKDINLINIMSIRESRAELDSNSGPESPYFSTNVKPLKSIKNNDSGIIEQPYLKSADSQKRYKVMKDTMINKRTEMNIQDDMRGGVMKNMSFNTIRK